MPICFFFSTVRHCRKTFVQTVHQYAQLHCQNLLPFGMALFVLGVEEPVLEIAFTEGSNEFFASLHQIAMDDEL